MNILKIKKYINNMKILKIQKETKQNELILIKYLRKDIEGI